MTKEVKTIENDYTHNVLVEPVITEESTRLAESNKYVFKISPRASKKQVEQAIKVIYKVSVKSVNTVTIPRKKVMRGRTQGWKSGYKKAIVTVKEGDKIDIFESK